MRKEKSNEYNRIHPVPVDLRCPCFGLEDRVAGARPGVSASRNRIQRSHLRPSSRIGKEEVEELLAAKEQQILSDLVYAAYLGFQANLSNFHNPVASQFIKLDYGVFLREHIMQTLPHRAAAEKTIAAFQGTYKDSLSEYEDAIQSYYIYLEVAGPKLAHFWGYAFANRFLPWVEPGYVSDGAQTSVYALELYRDLGFRVR